MIRLNERLRATPTNLVLHKLRLALFAGLALCLIAAPAELFGQDSEPDLLDTEDYAPLSEDAVRSLQFIQRPLIGNLTGFGDTGDESPIPWTERPQVLFSHIGRRSAVVMMVQNPIYLEIVDLASQESVPLFRKVRVLQGPSTYVITDLEPATTYELRTLTDESGSLAGYLEHLSFEPVTFRTLPLWEYRSDPPDLTFLMGSCAYINEPAYDRPGTPYGADYHIFETMADQNADVMLWLGDNVYFREVDFDSATSLALRYAHDRAIPELQRFWRSTSHLATWDDHDFGPNNSNRSYVHAETARDLFRAAWPHARLDQNGVGHGIASQVTVGDVDLFLLDNRSFRAPHNHPDLADKPMFGEAQLNWLLDALATSRATFKIVAAGGQMLNPLAPPNYETMNHFAHERQRLLEGIAEREVRGVFFLSGDRHYSEMIRLDRHGSYPLYEYTSSPLTSGVHTPRAELDNPFRVEGSLVMQRNFGKLQVSGPRENRRLTFSTHASDGSELWRHEITADELESRVCCRPRG